MIRIGLVDGALPSDWPGLRVQSRFCEADGCSLGQGHAEAMAKTIAHHAGEVTFQNAVIFPGRLSANVESVCAALEWLSSDPPEIVLCAFGMARSSVVLSVAIARLQQAGSLVIASAPARGGQAYPAALDGVLSVQGDARCGSAELSRLDLPHATYGACPVAVGTDDIQGASPAAAHLAGQLAIAVRSGVNAVPGSLETLIRYRGREQRGHEAASSRTTPV